MTKRNFTFRLAFIATSLFLLCGHHDSGCHAPNQIQQNNLMLSP